MARTEEIKPAEEPLARFLFDVMKRRGWSARQFSIEAGLHSGQVAHVIKTGRASPETCRKIARFLHLPDDEVLLKGGHVIPSRTAADDEGIDMQVEAELRQLPRDQQRLVAALAGVLVREGFRIVRVDGDGSAGQ